MRSSQATLKTAASPNASSSANYIDLLKRSLSGSLYEESAWQLIEEFWETPRSLWNIRLRLRRYFWQRLIRFLKARNIVLVSRKQYDPNERENGLDWPLIGFTMIGNRRLAQIQACVEDVLARNIPGDFMETGVWRGGSTILMRALLQIHGIQDRRVWCADSFEGLPKPNATDQQCDGVDLSHVDYLKVSLESVRANFARFGLLDDQVIFLKGWFRDTLPTAPVKQLALLRLDGDLYESTMDALNGLYHKISSGGYLIVDDYFSWKGCRRAVDEFRVKHQIKSEIKRIDSHAVYWVVS